MRRANVAWLKEYNEEHEDFKEGRAQKLSQDVADYYARYELLEGEREVEYKKQ